MRKKIIPHVKNVTIDIRNRACIHIHGRGSFDFILSFCTIFHNMFVLPVHFLYELKF